MIYALIALIVAGVVIGVLAIIVHIVIRRNSRLEREKKFDRLELESALAGKEALKAQNGRLQQELHYPHLELAQVQVQNTHPSQALSRPRLLLNQLPKDPKTPQPPNTPPS